MKLCKDCRHSRPAHPLAPLFPPSRRLVCNRPMREFICPVTGDEMIEVRNVNCADERDGTGPRGLQNCGQEAKFFEPKDQP